jgi:hypothetical protein
MADLIVPPITKDSETLSPAPHTPDAWNVLAFLIARHSLPPLCRPANTQYVSGSVFFHQCPLCGGQVVAGLRARTV